MPSRGVERETSCRAWPYVVHICRYLPYVYNAESTLMISRTRPKKKNSLGKPAMEIARFVSGEENDCRFEVQRKEH